MLRPSHAELMDVINNDSELDNKITSSYAIVIAASKRARQLVDGAVPLAEAGTDKAVSIAINEIYESRIRVVPEEVQPEPCDSFETIEDESSQDSDELRLDSPGEDDDLADDGVFLEFDDDAFDREVSDDEYTSDEYTDDYED